MKTGFKYLFSFFLLLLPLGESFGQNGNGSHGFWHQKSVSGEVKLKSIFRDQKSLFNDIGDDQQSIYYIGGIRLQSKSYLWDPEIVLLDLEGEFNPESRGEKYLSIPDRSEVRTLNKLGIKTTLFNNKIITLNSYLNLHQSYFNRELLTDVQSKNRLWGAILSTNNKFLPVSLSFRKSQWDQEELQTNRNFRMDQNNLEGRASKTFGRNDKSEFIYGRDEYKYLYSNLSEVYNQIDRISLSNNFYLDRDKNYNLGSLITLHNQEGDNKFRKLESMQRILFRLPKDFRVSGNYNYFMREDEFQVVKQNRVSGGLQHKLYESLVSKLFAEYSSINRSSEYESYETNIRAGIDFNYTKKIPFGVLNLSYKYFRHHQSAGSESPSLQIRNEAHILSDDEIVLLNRPFIDQESIIIRDETGSIIYQAGFDYLITERNNFYEIQRISGGLIANNQTVLVDYTSTPPESYDYDANNNNFRASVLIFKRVLELYYRKSRQDYSNVSETDFLTLNYYDQNTLGSRIDVGFARFGIEYDEYSSNIIPYQMMRYFMDINGRIGKKVLLSMNANIRDYLIIDNEKDRMYANISGRIAYSFKPMMKLNIDFGYLNQTGRNIELDALTARAEFNMGIRQIRFKAGLEIYRRLYTNSNYKLKGGYIQVSRKF